MNADTASKWCEGTLGNLDAAFRWAAGFVAVFFLTVSQSSSVKILDVEINRVMAGLVFFVLLTGSFIQIARGLSIILQILREGGDAAAKVASAIRLNTSVGNPFSETIPEPRALLDSIGVVVTVLVWFIGSRAGLLLLRSSGVKPEIGFGVYFLYCAVGIWIGVLIFRLFSLLSSTRRLNIARVVTGVFSILVGLGLLFYPVDW